MPPLVNMSEASPQIPPPAHPPLVQVPPNVIVAVESPANAQSSESSCSELGVGVNPPALKLLKSMLMLSVTLVSDRCASAGAAQRTPHARTIAAALVPIPMS